MWIFIWLIFSLFILGVFAWSMQTLYRQKQVWKVFAAKMNLTYQPGQNFLSSPSITGAIGPYGFSLHTERIPTPDLRGERFSMIVEFALRQGIPAFGAAGTPGVIPAIEALDLPQVFVPADTDWNPAWVIRTRNAKVVEAYLTQPRLDVLKKIFRMKILSGMFVFDTPDAVIRVETYDPLDDLDRLEKIVKGLAAQIAPLTMTEDEQKQLKAIAG